MTTRIFTVTAKAMRPALSEQVCFYCRQPIGSTHAENCVLVVKTVTVKMEVEYEVEVPAHWDAKDVEFHRNDSSWCMSNALRELLKINDGCHCARTKFTFIAAGDDVRLMENR